GDDQPQGEEPAGGRAGRRPGRGGRALGVVAHQPGEDVDPDARPPGDGEEDEGAADEERVDAEPAPQPAGHPGEDAVVGAAGEGEPVPPALGARAVGGGAPGGARRWGRGPVDVGELLGRRTASTRSSHGPAGAAIRIRPRDSRGRSPGPPRDIPDGSRWGRGAGCGPWTTSSSPGRPARPTT